MPITLFKVIPIPSINPTDKIYCVIIKYTTIN
ncbi:uncharacterized protein METZ01_LOCUS188545 [marine metagenome]|uniref:Uncharacterized protein n=1 Tax=marine metagenome TaxID=408172 RepID=A0A382DDE6_9ZZZZ